MTRSEIWRLLVCALLVPVPIFLVLVYLDDAAGAAAYRESSGMTRGSVLDRSGLPLDSADNSAARGGRKYSLPSLALVTGYRDPGGHWQGLEGRYDRWLEATAAQHDWRTFFLHLRGTAAQGGDLRLTLDRHLQQVADDALGSARGSVVALDPKSGAVLAMVSKPYCRPQVLSDLSHLNRCLRQKNRPMLRRATNQVLSPGSSFKIVTMTAALDSGRFHLSDVFAGSDVFGPSPYFNNTTYPSNINRNDLTAITLSQALAFSDNFTFAHIGVTLGATVFSRYARRFMVGRKIPFDFPVRPSYFANGHTRISTSELAQSSFGSSVDQVTPLQMALVASTVANKGVMMSPHLVADQETHEGRVIWRYRDHVLSRVMTKRAAADITTAMEFVVNHGSGFKAQIPHVRVAGKTGTAASGGQRNNAWFISFAPARNPVIAVAVSNEMSGEGFKYAAPIARKIIVAALREPTQRVAH